MTTRNKPHSRDDAMCEDDWCPSRMKCWRHNESGRMAQTNQVWAGFSHGNEDRCEYFIDADA